jgi:hypothetical protein
MERPSEDCSGLLRSVLYHYTNTPAPERLDFVANLVAARDRCLDSGALATLPAKLRIYVLRQAGWVALLADEPLPKGEAFFAASSNLLPAELRDCHLVVYVRNALLYLTRLTDRQYAEAQALRLSPTWQRHPRAHWRMVTQLLRHVGTVRQRAAELLRDPGPKLDTLVLTELAELIEQGLVSVSLLGPNDAGFARLRRQIAALPGKKNPARTTETRLYLVVSLLSVAAVACTTWLLGSLVR